MEIPINVLFVTFCSFLLPFGACCVCVKLRALLSNNTTLLVLMKNILPTKSIIFSITEDTDNSIYYQTARAEMLSFTIIK